MSPAVAPVVACVQWVDLRPEIDLLHATVSTDPRRHGFSDADRAAFETALRLGEAWGTPVWLIGAAPSGADAALIELGASGADRIIRVDGVADDASAARVAAALAGQCGDAVGVVCGDYGLAGGSGAVPAMLAHELGAAQALGLVEVEVEVESVEGESTAQIGSKRVRAVRRLDGGRRERVEVRAPFVISTEGAVATLRRGSLRRLAASSGVVVEVVSAGVAPIERLPVVASTTVWRPRPRALPAPVADDPHQRILALTGVLVDRTPPRRIELPPAEAADAIIEQLRAWGYLETHP